MAKNKNRKFKKQNKPKGKRKNIKNQPKKKDNKNQKKIKRGGYTKKEKKQVDLNQELRLKSIEKKLEDVDCLHNLRNPPYNAWINNHTGALINTWIDMGSNQSVQDCYDLWDVTPNIHLPSYFRDVVTGGVILNSTKEIPNLGPVDYLDSGSVIQNLQRPNKCQITKFKSTFNYRQYIFSGLDTSGDFPTFPFNKEYINNNIFRIRLYLISQPVLNSSTENKIAHIARQLAGPFQTQKASKYRVTEGYGNLDTTESNLNDKLKYTVHYDETIKPKFTFMYDIKTTTGATQMSTQKVYMISLVRNPEIILNKDLQFSMAYNIENNINPNNLTLHWVMKFADIEQSKFINDQISGSTDSHQCQYKNNFNIRVKC